MSIQFLEQLDMSFWLLLMIILIYVVWIFNSFRGNKKLFGLGILRTIVFFALIFLMTQPKLVWKDRIQEDLKWNLYVDRSVSMGYHHSISPSSYINGVRSFVTSVNEKMDNSSVIYFDHALNKDAKFELVGGATDLGIVLEHIRKNDKSLSGAIIITDGQVTKGEKENYNLTDINVPIHIIGVGDTIPMIDVAIHEINAPTVVIKGEDFTTDVSITALGQVDGRINVLLYKNNKLIGSKFIHLSGEGSVSNVKFMVSANELGENNYNIKATVLEDEINIDNNNRKFSVTVLKDKYRVGLITGSPNFNTGPIKRIVSDIPRIELDHYIQKKDQFSPSINQFWSTPYELIILENFPIEPLSGRWQRIFAKKIAAERSGIFIYAGPNVSERSFKTVSPIVHVNKFDKGGNKLANWYWTDDRLINNLNSDLSIVDLPPLTPNINLLLSDDQRSLAYYENSEYPVLYVGEEDDLRYGVWTASDFSTGYYKLTESQNEKLIKTAMSEILSWLIKLGGDEELYFRFNKDLFQQGEEIKLIGTHYTDENTDISSITGYVSLNKNGKKHSNHELHFDPVKSMWKAEFIAGKPGKYNYEILFDNKNNIKKQNGTIFIDESQIELNNVSLNTYPLSDIADRTKGKFYNWKTRAELLDILHNKQLNETIIRSAKLNENIIIIIVIIFFLSIEWYIRRLIGYN